MKHGLFIALEGGEGAGKSTQAGLLEALLLGNGVDVIRTREPGGTDFGFDVRRLIMRTDPKPSRRAEALLYAADRAHHVETILIPALMEGKVVICDRFIASSLAYQADAGGLDYGTVKWLSTWAADGLWPHLTFFLDVPPEVGLARAKSRGVTNRFEDEELDFHRTVRKSFQQQAISGRWVTIDATQPLLTVHRQIAAKAMEETKWFGLLDGKEDR